MKPEVSLGFLFLYFVFFYDARDHRVGCRTSVYRFTSAVGNLSKVVNSKLEASSFSDLGVCMNLL